MAELRVNREFTAPPERLWAAFTSPDALAAWMWPPSWATVAEVDLRPGGRYRIASETMDMAVAGVYESIESPTSLTQTWKWDGEAGQTVVTLTIAAIDSGSRLTLVHDGFPTAEEASIHLQGWNDCLDRLPGYVS